MNVSLLKNTMLINEVEFFLKVVVLLVILRTNWVMWYVIIDRDIRFSWGLKKIVTLIFD